MELTPWNIISCSATILFIVPVILFIQTGNLHEIGHLITLLGVMFGAEGIKRYVTGNEEPEYRRPAAARDCDMWCMNGPQGGQPGMPSGHMAVTTAFVTLYWPKSGNPPELAVALVIYVLIMAAARWTKSCHTIAQIIAGSILGGIAGSIYRAVIEN
jgi:hypothetical protein